MTRGTGDRHVFLLGSANRGKLREYREILQGLDLELIAPSDLEPVPPEPDEDAATYAENASAKARAYARASGLPTIADDSGLEVSALRGAPGVRSRRFFGEDATAEERNAKLLALLDGVADRSARFVCVTEPKRTPVSPALTSKRSSAWPSRWPISWACSKLCASLSDRRALTFSSSATLDGVAGSVSFRGSRKLRA